jgi:alkyldihydroxyacetonephosphate synthase
VPEQPELTIQGWGPHPTGGSTDATGDRAPDLEAVIPKAARRHLAKELNWTPRHTPPVPVAEIRLAPSRLTETARLALVELLGEDNVRTDRESRLLRAGGKSYLDLLRRRAGDATDAPCAVVLPGTTEETAALLALCSEHDVVVVPFGGGTSVVG